MQSFRSAAPAGVTPAGTAAFVFEHVDSHANESNSSRSAVVSPRIETSEPMDGVSLFLRVRHTTALLCALASPESRLCTDMRRLASCAISMTTSAKPPERSR